MILVVDSGSSKTDWIAINKKGNTIFSTQTLGLNPQVLSSVILKERILNNFELSKNRNEVAHLYFYGAGCGIATPKQRITKIFKDIFINSHLDVKEDTYAAVYSIVEVGAPSIVCILGTGSNCTYFDGENIEQRIVSLGYILMDEASGNFYGKQLIRAFCFNEMPDELRKEFEDKYNLDPDVVKEHLYRKENPNTYLSTFAEFLIKHKKHPFIIDIIQNGLDRFIKHQILQFKNAKEIPIHFVGSIAYFLKNEIKKALKKYHLKLGKIVKRPIDGLVTHHKNLLDTFYP